MIKRGKYGSGSDGSTREQTGRDTHMAISILIYFTVYQFNMYHR